MGQLTPSGMTDPACPGKLNGNNEEFLSTECTIEHLMDQPAQVQELLSGVYQKVNAAFVALLGHTEGTGPLLKMMTIGSFMKSIDIPAEEIEVLDKSLRLIPNQQSFCR